jgi:hypothetical protein
LKLGEGKRLDIEFERKRREIKIKVAPDILDLAGTFRPKRKILNPVKIREMMEKKMYKPR